MHFGFPKRAGSAAPPAIRPHPAGVPGWRLFKLYTSALGLSTALATTVGVLLPLAVLPVSAQAQQAATTAITDTVLQANGSPAQGVVLISWPAFTGASGVAIPQGSTSVTLGGNGSLSVQLVPNAGSTPLGSFYTVVYHLSDGTVTREYWSVPASSGAVALSAVRTSVLPASVAVQTVSKQYVDTAIARAVQGGAVAGGTVAAGPGAGNTTPYVQKAGDTMTGPLQLSGDPATGLQAADKSYVDGNVAAAQAGLNQKVSKIPTGTQIVTQPAGTQLRTNRLNAELYASQFFSSFGNDGIANAFNAPECGANCQVIAEPDYNGNDSLPAGKFGAHLSDRRLGQLSETFTGREGGGLQYGTNIVRTDAQHPATVTSTLQTTALRLQQSGLRGGNNLFPEGVTSALPYFKTTYGTLIEQADNYAQGQHVMDTRVTNCYGVGDCLIHGDFMSSSGGFRDAADEGAHPADLQYTEDTRVPRGNCGTGCTTGSQSLKVNFTSGAGTQGDGRFLVDLEPSKGYSGNALIGGDSGGYPAATAVFTGTSFPVSTFFSTAGAALPQSNNMAPGAVTLPIATGGVIAGFSTNTASAPAGSGTACVADAISGGTATPENYEMAPYTVVDGTHLRLTLLKPHATGSVVAMGGLCGYGLEQTIDSSNGYQQVFPIVGSSSGTSLYVASGLTSIVGRNFSTSGYLNLQFQVTSVVRSNNVVTVNITNTAAGDLTGLPLTLAGVADASFNGTFNMSTVGSGQFSYPQTGPNASSSGGTLVIVTSGYNIYPMAEVLDVYNDATGNVDGQMTLAPNTVPWAAGDRVTQPHYFQQRVGADVTYITQYTPRPSAYQPAGIYYQGNNGGGLRGWVIANNTPAQSYLGDGGTHVPPDFAFGNSGVWNTTADFQAGEQTAFRMHCNGRGCSRFDSTYNLFALDNSVGGGSYDAVTWAPQTSTMTWNMRGAQYSMSPTAMTVGTLNVTNLNASHISGSTAATSTAQGSVQLGPTATSFILSNVASSGAASDMTGLAPSATIDTTNAANITGGTLDPARLPPGIGGGSCASTIAFSAAPAIAVSCSNALIHVPLTGNMTGMSFTGLQAGQRITLVFQVGGTGGYTVQWPSQVHGGFATSTSNTSPFYAQAGKYFVQQLVVDADGATLLNPGAVNQ